MGTIAEILKMAANCLALLFINHIHATSRLLMSVREVSDFFIPILLVSICSGSPYNVLKGKYQLDKQGTDFLEKERSVILSWQVYFN